MTHAKEMKVGKTHYEIRTAAQSECMGCKILSTCVTGHVCSGGEGTTHQQPVKTLKHTDRRETHELCRLSWGQDITELRGRTSL